MSLTSRRDKVAFIEGIRNGTRKLNELSTANEIQMAFVSLENPEMAEWEGELHSRKELERRFPRQVIFINATEEVKKLLQKKRGDTHTRTPQSGK